MGEIVNLRRAKKARARLADEKAADANRIRHGTPKPLRKAAESESQRVTRTHEAHRMSGVDPRDDE